MSSRLEFLIVDSGAIIRGHGLGFHKVAKEDGFYTVEEVIREISDSKSRELLNSLPFELHVRQPPDSAMRAVANFAKKTGDFAALSLTDLKLLALTYALEVEVSGGERIRLEPAKRSVHAQPRPMKNSSAEMSSTLESSLDFDNCTPCDCDGQNSVEPHPESEECADPDSRVEAHEETGIHADVDAVEGEGSVRGDFVGEAEAGESEEAEYLSDSKSNEGEQGPFVGKVGEDSQGLLEGVTDKHHGVDSSQVLQDPIVSAVEEERQEGAGGDPESATLTADDFPPLQSLADSLPKIDELTLDAGKRPLPPRSWAGMLSATRDQPMRPMPSSGSQDSDKVISKAVSAVGEQYFSAASSMRLTDRPEVKEGARESRILSSSGNASQQASQRSIEEDDGVGWINSSNIDSFRAKGGGLFSIPSDSMKKAEKDTEVRVACVTTDFSMQNVLLQMNLRVMSVDGMLVRNVKKWVLRCSACYRIHAELDRLFCSKCGANHLHRIACSVDSSTGQLKLHLKKNYQYNLRGKIHPLPKPGQQGKYEGELLLREDQLLSGIWKQKLVKINRDVKSAFGPDVVSDLGLQLNKGAKIKVGLGRANPNADKGRSKRGSNKKR